MSPEREYESNKERALGLLVLGFSLMTVGVTLSTIASLPALIIGLCVAGVLCSMVAFVRLVSGSRERPERSP